MNKLIRSFAGKKILVTGHTGFKGTWLSRILVLGGATVYGLALEAEKNSLFSKVENLGLHNSKVLDIRSKKNVEKYFAKNLFDGIFHMAAQPLVQRSYDKPIETFETNVMGTAHLLNSVISNKSAPWVVVITTDKVYKNVNTIEGYSENDPLGGEDPYSASKASTEMVVSAWKTIAKQSFPQLRISSVRAGNVIGGGDTAENRLMPDLIKSFKENKAPIIRNPNSIRPWQHVLDPLNGYLMVGNKLMQGLDISPAYNFGPCDNARLTVEQVANLAIALWPGSKHLEIHSDPTAVHESELLWLASDLAQAELSWTCKLNAEQAIAWAIEWEKNSMISNSVKAMDEQIIKFFGVN